MYRLKVWVLFNNFLYSDYALVFGVGRFRSVEVDFCRPTVRSVLHRPTETTVIDPTKWQVSYVKLRNLSQILVNKNEKFREIE